MAGISGAITSRRVAISRQATRALLRDGLPACDLREYEPPRIEQRDVVASSRAASDFGWLLEERARRLKLHTGARQAFVADGAKTNWRI
ncbi:MAG: hypothetical protein KDB11_15450 [Planctomycetales bacterium]|nr:hypothetical protein [Planctomycetales bacterium]